MVVKSQNMWGKAGGYEAQRADLWVLDLELIAGAIRRSAFAGRLELPPQGETLHFARSVAMPEARIAEVEVKALNTPKLYPGFDEPTGGVRVDFLMDADSTGLDPGSLNVTSTSQLNRSKIYSLLYGWRILTRIGRLPYASEDIAVPLPTLPVALGNTFKFDVKLYFLKGVTEDQTDINAGFSVGNTAGMEVSMAYILRKCWISSIQLNGIDQNSGNSPLTVSAVLIPEEIHPFEAIDFDIAIRRR
jgi:hypothetical protein